MDREEPDVSQNTSAAADPDAQTPVTRPSYMPYLFGVIGIFIVQVSIGALLTPGKIIQIAGTAPPALSVRIGYGLGLLVFVSIPFLALISLPSLLFRSQRNLSSFFKISFWTVFTAFLANMILQIMYVPRLIQ
jgi:hypothetical protein